MTRGLYNVLLGINEMGRTEGLVRGDEEAVFRELRPVRELEIDISSRMKHYLLIKACINQLFRLAREFSQDLTEEMRAYGAAKEMVEKFRKKMIDAGHAQYDSLCDAQLELIEIERRKYQKDWGKCNLK